MSTAIEEATTRAFQNAAYEAVKTEHSQYFDLLDKHPRLLAGQQVPAIGKEGVEVLRDANDAREWQDAVKSLLVAEIRSRASKDLDENKDYINTLHASVELFTKNADLVPGTKEFDTELANRFATLAQPYELRVDGRLQGYSIPVQPIIDSIRGALTAERAAKPSPPATAAPAATPSPGAGGEDTSKTEQPQAGIQSKAGSGAEVEDFSTLFGTLGLPGLKI